MKTYNDLLCEIIRLQSEIRQLRKKIKLLTNTQKEG